MYQFYSPVDMHYGCFFPLLWEKKVVCQVCLFSLFRQKIVYKLNPHTKENIFKGLLSSLLKRMQKMEEYKCISKEGLLTLRL